MAYRARSNSPTRSIKFLAVKCSGYIDGKCEWAGYDSNTSGLTLLAAYSHAKAHTEHTRHSAVVVEETSYYFDGKPE